MEFIPTNDLEKILIKASMEAGARPEFYRILKLSDIYVIGNDAVPDDNGIAGSGSSISIRNAEIDGKLYLAAFTSKEQLCRTIDNDTNYYKIKFEDLLSMIGDTEIALNPNLEYGKILNVYEVAGLRDGTIWKPQNTMTMKKDVQVTIGKPKNEPKELIIALSKYFQNQKSIISAYNVHYYNPETDEKAHTLICVKGIDRQEAISAEIGIISSSVNVPDPPVDVIFINTKNGFRDYICKSFKPFYRKTKKLFGLF